MNLLWLKSTDLRLIDNPALTNCLKNNKTIIVFCISQRLFSKDNIIKVKKFGKFKEKFLYESLLDFNSNINKKKGILISFLKMKKLLFQS